MSDGRTARAKFGQVRGCNRGFTRAGPKFTRAGRKVTRADQKVTRAGQKSTRAGRKSTRALGSAWAKIGGPQAFLAPATGRKFPLLFKKKILGERGGGPNFFFKTCPPKLL